MRYLIMAAIALPLLVGGCAGPEHLQLRDGYTVDHSWVSPSHNSRVRHLVLHYTDIDEAGSLEVLTGPHVSAHYVLPLPARHYRGEPLIYQLVDEERRAWHAGASAWKERTNINDTSIGIEIVNSGWAPYPKAQIEALIALSRDIIARHNIHPTNVVAHSDIAPNRKIDPGPHFPWRQLYEAGIGVWPDTDAIARWQARFTHQPPSLTNLQQALKAWGYPLEATSTLDRETRAVLRAFQMRFRPVDYRGEPDIETAATLWALLERYQPQALERLE